jgi:EF hand
MFLRPQRLALFLVVAGAVAVGQAGSPGTPDVVSPQSPKVAAGEVDAKRMLLLMDTDKNGKVSRQEFMNFMAAEFDRLDKNKDGQLDVKELTQSQLVPARTSGVHR